MSTLRAEKTTRNVDDFRVLMAGCMIAIMLMVGGPFMQKMYDTFIQERPFMVATVEIVQEGNDEPFILYDTDPNEPVSGYWIASMVGEDGEQLLTRQGEGSYSNDVDLPHKWTWFAFFDNDKGFNSPGIPNVPFRVCVRYDLTTRDSGTVDSTPNYCSNLFIPKSFAEQEG